MMEAHGRLRWFQVAVHWNWVLCREFVFLYAWMNLGYAWLSGIHPFNISFYYPNSVSLDDKFYGFSSIKGLVKLTV